MRSTNTRFEGCEGVDPNFCANCGQQLNPIGSYCPNCGSKIMKQVDNELIVQTDEESGISDELLLAFVKTKQDVYLRKWKKPSYWNWASFLFGPMWLAYRKMYVEMVIYFGIITLSTLFEVLTDASSFIYVLDRLVWILAGVYGNKIYYRKAKKTIEEIMFLHKDKEARLLLISKKGGTSVWSMVAVGIGIVVLVFLPF